MKISVFYFFFSYEGEWKNDVASGTGDLFHSNGDHYSGSWRDDKANGFGIFKQKDGSRYEGDWKDDLQHGRGKEYWLDGAVFEGIFVKGKKQGRGTMTFPNGCGYEGEFQDNKIQGKFKILAIFFTNFFHKFLGKFHFIVFIFFLSCTKGMVPIIGRMEKYLRGTGGIM